MTIAIIVVGLRMLWREKSDSWVFFVGAIFVFPVLLSIVHGSGLFYVRYFIVSIAFFLILFSFVLADFWLWNARGKIFCTCLLLAYVAANGWSIVDLLRHGRGRYYEAVDYIVDHSEESPVTIGSDHDFRNATMLEFYVPLIKQKSQVRYFPGGAWPLEGPEWVICHQESFEPAVPLATQLNDSSGNTYEWVKTFPTAPLSGLHWFLFHHSPK
jgi:hypothetical protein